VKTAHNSQRSKASNAVLVTEQSCKGGGGVKSFRGLEACNLATTSIAISLLLTHLKERHTHRRHALISILLSSRKESGIKIGIQEI
jgi:hypothetical protein